MSTTTSLSPRTAIEHNSNMPPILSVLLEHVALWREDDDALARLEPILLFFRRLILLDNVELITNEEQLLRPPPRSVALVSVGEVSSTSGDALEQSYTFKVGSSNDPHKPAPPSAPIPEDSSESKLLSRSEEEKI